MPEHIISVPVEQSIIVRAGPGAGKTYLIAQRIAYLLKTGIRKNSHVACITYTNTGIEEIEEELIPKHFSSKPNDLSLGTIHSFLIEYILKPYGHFLQDLPEGFLLTPPNGYVNRFITLRNLSPHKLPSFEAIGYDQDGDLICYRPIRQGNSDELWMPSDIQMREFKNKMHRAGYIDLYDVLFFSWKVLREFPFVTECLTSRFASILVDEFQDTTVIQNAILEIFLDSGKTSLFIVGDPDQSIFSFAGAKPQTFRDYFNDSRFHCEICGEIQHQVNVNRRSSQRVIDFLNTCSTISGGQIVVNQDWANYNQPVLVLTGGVEKDVDPIWFRKQALVHFFKLLETSGIDRDSPEAFGVLAHQNKLVALLNALDNDNDVTTESPLDRVRKENRPLHRIVYNLILALKHKQVGEWAEAYQLVNQALTYHLYSTTPHFCAYDDQTIGVNRDLWRVSTWLIMDRLPDNQTLTIREWCGELKEVIADAIEQVRESGNSIRRKLGILDCRSNRVRQIAESSTVSEALSAVFRPNLLEENFRTIHKAKGTQRDAILVMADSVAEFEEWFFSPNLNDSEISRRGFVAFSRARKILCICCDSITSSQQQRLSNMNVELEIIQQQPSLF